MNEWCCYYLSYLLLTALLSDHIRSCTLMLTLRITRDGIDRWYNYSLSPSPYSGLRKLRVSPTLLAIARNFQWKFRLSGPLVSYSVQYFSECVTLHWTTMGMKCNICEKWTQISSYIISPIYRLGNIGYNAKFCSTLSTLSPCAKDWNTHTNNNWLGTRCACK